MNVRTIKRAGSNYLEMVVDGTRQKILAGDYRLGEKMPTEPQLQEEWGVSRSVVREAMKILASQGLVRVEQGRGTFVNEAGHAPLREQLELALLRHSPTHAKNETALDEWDALLDLRFVLEVGAAERAATSASPADLDQIWATIESIRLHPADAHACGRDDFNFHRAIASATHNPLWPVILSGLHDLLQRYMEASHFGEAGGISTSNEHEAIWRAICDGDSEAAGMAMRLHLESSRRDLRLAREQQLLPPLISR